MGHHQGAFHSDRPKGGGGRGPAFFLAYSTVGALSQGTYLVPGGTVGFLEGCLLLPLAERARCVIQSKISYYYVKF